IDVPRLASWTLLLIACNSGYPSTTPDAGGPLPPSRPTTITQAPLTLEMALGSGSGSGSAPTTLEITARDNTTPAITDPWLSTPDATGAMTPLTGFTSNAARKTPSLMLPATIAGTPSGLVPADDGRQNGVMTGVNRGVLSQGAFISTV